MTIAQIGLMNVAHCPNPPPPIMAGMMFPKAVVSDFGSHCGSETGQDIFGDKFPLGITRAKSKPEHGNAIGIQQLAHLSCCRMENGIDVQSAAYFVNDLSNGSFSFGFLG